MAVYEVAHSKAGVNTAGTVYWVIRSTVSTRRLQILEIGIEVATAPTNGQDWRCVRTATLGTATANVAGQPIEISNTLASNGQVVHTWSANPTIGTVDLRRLGLPATQGSSLIWTWPEHRPLEVSDAATGGIALANANASGATLGSFAMYVVYRD